MNKRMFLLIPLLSFITACANVATSTARMDWAGTYDELGTRRINDQNSLTGKRSKVIGTWQLKERTTDIQAALGARFGICYTLDDGTPDTAIHYKVIWYFPENGMTNPVTKKRANWHSREKTCHSGKPSFTGWIFNEPWEMVPGTWVVEIWVKDKRLLRQMFQVSVK